MPTCKHPYPLTSVVDGGGGRYSQPHVNAIYHAITGMQPAFKKAKTETSDTEIRPNVQLPPKSTFPAPVIVPDDLLFLEGDDDPQTVEDFEEVRNRVTAERRTIYVVPPPTISEGLEVLEWPPTESKAAAESGRKRRAQTHGSVATRSPATGSTRRGDGGRPVESPQMEHLVEYLQAFYHDLPVKALAKSEPLAFVDWEDDVSSVGKTGAKAPQSPTRIGLAIGDEAVGIRCRPSKDGEFKAQLNLNDLLDVAIEILPKDAYALLMLVDHDLYEDDDDDFCCGRAYGGSRVAVVSTARYNPGLDETQQIDLAHSWPGSHCFKWVFRKHHGKRRFVFTRSEASRTERMAVTTPVSAVAAAIVAANKGRARLDASKREALWLGRVCKTASHELGHCFGIGHCGYYACIMQGTANIVEDTRQPPYLCPADLTKVLRATEASEKERYRALLEFCGKWKDDKMFAAFHAWLEVRLQQPDIITI